MANIIHSVNEFEKYLAKWTETPMGRKQFLASIPLLMLACASGEKGRYREGRREEGEIAMSVEEEKALGEEIRPRILQDYPPVQDPELQQYMDEIGQKVVRANGLHGKPYKYNFTAVNAGFVNAFALPAGTVMVTTPLIAMAESEAELVGVVGHEIGHIEARHSASRMEAAKNAQTASWKYAASGGLIGGLLGLGAGKIFCPPRDNACLAKAAGLGAVAGGAGALLVQKYQFMANSREDEMEADRIGFRRSLNAGYDKNHIGKFYDRLYLMEQEAKAGQNPLAMRLNDAISTHPPSRDRVAQMKSMTNESKNKPGAIVSSTEFDKMRKKSEFHASRFQG
ncbi:MAG: M48 family metalloprotease [Leptospira sp.]|nr:M48 family metalloprotease [Leptospira sp.]